MNLQPVFDLVQLCHLKGIQHAVISPGSRNAALTIAFARHPEIKCYSVPDERSAAFIALGISLKSQLPTVLICTSGSAALNYAPAVAEAFFNQVPLLILSADRPPEWIGQRDGQTIFQENLFGRHVKAAYVFPSLENNESARQAGHTMINEAINTSLSEDKGPVHINIPFREPFYPETGTLYGSQESLPVIPPTSNQSLNWKEGIDSICHYTKILIVVGQSAKSEEISAALSLLSIKYHLTVIADVISNGHDVAGVISSQDIFLKNLGNESLQPDLLITIGLSVISKNLKIFLRTHKPKAHWHVRNESISPDTYLALSQHIKADALPFLHELPKYLRASANQRDFQAAWQAVNTKTKAHIKNYTSQSFSDFNGYKRVLLALPDGSDLHLANSMAVRYANTIGLAPNKDIEVYCNRGTSGIDGSNSTAIGTALMSDRPTYLLTGDMAFLYDRNAFWHNHLPDHLHIVVFNNQGGGIFRMIDGPSQQPELKEYFETHQQRDAKWLAQEFDFEYTACANHEALEKALPGFMKPGKRNLLEIFTDAEESKQAYKELFRKLTD
ncbi:2-succinyl-5-enolpyruvyl-6-hydroxy-3-cyclohexene-1-carboxylic-acid synthase [Reichenbachiella carrageenanivorans]|uniref:2-succinyl-5-enolpyruvyl-6-hydroxy-3-cyclohexene-1-carboxylate synthase n=1 Tax=Reichenbachiella carrageenanivorans TaxID=2979869 RepID=A0ABY6CYE9_9BACT|nr:2-succinyl-5-enolpyruvyl-6-hydroxy-3-cyclohexene-1-carboxylic-acid synthase [Reichenbachiella carrageenanivorans]UXX78937.1 2-succinyl-5-enolpyruvyl-6-hydroxy-3-cyclohexene-1-carboxylic-acid synthase [Reichenbachiella carrageenanivorans]